MNLNPTTSTNTGGYTPNGYKLLSKETGIQFDEYQLKAMGHILPEGTTSYDMITIESNWGKGQKNIITFRDKDGKLLKRITSESKDGKEISKTISLYKKEDKDDSTYSEIERNTYVNNKITEKTREAFTVDKIYDSVVHSKLTAKTETDGTIKEHQTLEQRDIGATDRSKYIETDAVRLPNGELTDKKVESNIADPKELMEDPYLFFRTYNNADFYRAIILLAKEKQGISDRTVHFIDTSLSDCSGYSISLPFYKRIAVDSSKSEKPYLVNTVNHECRHQWQDKFLKKYSFLHFLFKKPVKGMNEQEQELAPKLWLAGARYGIDKLTFDGYYNNFREVDARETGKTAEDEYVSFGKKLKQLFMTADLRMLGLNLDSFSVKKMLKELIKSQIEQGKIVRGEDLIISQIAE